MLLGLGDNGIDIYEDLGVAFAGGNTVNVAACAAQAGMAAGYLGRVGDDPAGAALLAEIARAGVDVGRCRIVPGATSWTRVRLEGRERRFVGHHPGPPGTLELTAEDRAHVARFAVVHGCVYGRMDAVLAAAKGAGQTLSYDLADKLGHLEALPLAAIDVLFLSGSALDAEGRRGLARRVLDAGVAEAIVTRGAGGAAAFSAAGERTQPAVPANVVDTLGAGDSFIARYLVGRARGEDIAARLAAAAHAAARTCERLGAFGAPLDAPWPD